MEDEEPEPNKEGLELVYWHTTRAVNRAKQFVLQQPVVALLILVIFIYLVTINRKLSRMEHAFNELLQLHKTALEQLVKSKTPE
jgi:hypothetical protein